MKKRKEKKDFGEIKRAGIEYACTELREKIGR
jgi:hypothetical protein